MIQSSTEAYKWSTNELDFYRIYSKETDVKEFFKLSPEELREPSFLDPGYAQFLTRNIFDSLKPSSAADHIVKALMDALRDIHLRDWTSPTPEKPISTTDQLAEKLLALIGYDQDAVLRCNQPVKLQMCGEERELQVNIAVLDALFTSYIFFCMEDKRTENGEDPFPQLMAYAIASFQCNNRCRQLIGMASLKSMVFPAISMRSSLPVFYRIIITRELADAVASGFRPVEPTEVAVLPPPVNSEKFLFGLTDTEARKPILKVLENMKDFMILDMKVIPEAWGRFIDTRDIFITGPGRRSICDSTKVQQERSNEDANHA